MAHPLMPKATAVWLVENTALTFEQVSEYCGLHPLEVQAIADNEVAIGMQGLDPITNGELTQDEIDRCSADPEARLVAAAPSVLMPRSKPTGARYTPVSKRQDRPDAISWLLKNYPELSDAQISKLIGTTKPTINTIRDKSHWNTINIKPQNPVALGLCSGADLEKAVDIARARAGTVHGKKPAEDKPAAKPEPEPAAEPVTEPEPASEPAAKPEPEPAAETAAEPEPASEPAAKPEPEPAAEPVTEPEPASEPAAKPEPEQA